MNRLAACLSLILLAGAARAEVRSGLRGINIDPINPWANPSPETVKRLGLTRVRFVYKVDHARVFEAVERYVEAGLAVTLVLNNETADLVGAHWPPGPSKAAQLLYRLNFARAATEAGIRLRRFGDRVSYQLWNEENLEGSWVDPEEYGPLARQTAAALRAAHPKAKIVLGSLLHNGDSVAYLRKAWKADSGLIDAVDEVGVHVYGEVAGRAGRMASSYLPFGKPLSLTEWGECGLSPQGNGAQIRAAQAELSRLPAVAEAFYFSWSETQSPGCGYGLSEPRVQPDWQGELFDLKPEMAWAFRPDGWGTWESLEPDVRAQFEAAYGDRARARWETEHAWDSDTPGWRDARRPE